MLEINLEVILLSIVNFFILLIILKKIFLSKLMIFLAERKQGIIDKFEKIKNENFKITEEKKEIKKKRESAIIEGKEIVNKYKEKAVVQGSKIVKEASEEVESIRIKNNIIIKEEEENYVKRMKSITKDVSVEICKKVLCDILDERVQGEILDAYIDRLEQNDV